jgi:hypothetical protein
MTRRLNGLIVLALGIIVPVCAAAQSDGSEPSLGDLARALRQGRTTPAAPAVIDNDNLVQIMDEVQSRRLSGSLLFSFDGMGRKFQMSSPDVSCSLSFNAKATSLLSDPFVAQDLPASEVVKLDGPASIRGGSLEVSVRNGSQWEIREITVGLTILQRPETDTAHLPHARLVPAAETTSLMPGKTADRTVLYHLKGSAGPSATSVFREMIGTGLTPDQDWHWAIVQAKGIPPKPAAN